MSNIPAYHKYSYIFAVITVKKSPLLTGRWVVFLIAFLIKVNHVNAITDTFRIHTDLPVFNSDKGILLNLFYSSDTVLKGMLQVKVFRYGHGDDSILVLKKMNSKFAFRKGTIKTILRFSEQDSNTYYAQKFYDIFERTRSMPPGPYKIFLSAKCGNKDYEITYLYEIDTLLSPQSPIRGDINKSLAYKSKSFLGIRLHNATSDISSSKAGNALANAGNRINKSIRKKGFTSVEHQNNDKSQIDLYYKDWFAGRYEVKSDEGLKKQVKLQDDLSQPGNFNSINTGLDHPSLFSQYKSLNQKKRENNVSGEIGFSTNISNGQEQYSDVDNNSYELKGRIEFPICNIPLEAEGLYTSLDNHREIKASYIKLHYDVDKMKNELQQSANSYNSKVSATSSQSAGMHQIYGAAISKLEAERAKLQKGAGGGNSSKLVENGQDGKVKNAVVNKLKTEAKDTSGLNRALNGTSGDTTVNDEDDEPSDSSKTQHTSSDSKAQKRKINEDKAAKKINEEKKEAEEKRRQIDAIDKKIERYKKLLAQYDNTNHFDSLVSYDKTKGLTNQSDLTYKQMAKKGSDLLPDGQAKGFIAGITKLDAGMFSKEESKFTISGQMMKGVDWGYDLGFCETSVTIGKTQYIGSDGSLDKYTFYAGKASFKPAKGQKVSLLYYRYSPDRKMITNDAFFNNANISAPGFFQPVQIISTQYGGSISKFVKMGVEVATSITPSRQDNSPTNPSGSNDKMAYHFNADGRIPNTSISLEGDYDKTGLGFVNNTLPLSLVGTEQYKISGRTDLIHSLVTVGLEYNRMIQHNFVSTGRSTKMGFDVKTNLKRYPNVSLSYKPFSTFQSYSDTLSIPQRPLIGSVWNGKITYQIKRHQRSLRLSLLYSANMTTMDTMKYGSATSQFSSIYADKVKTLNVNVGIMQIAGSMITVTPVTTPNNTEFVNSAVNYILNKHISISEGQDISFAPFGICKYSFNCGSSYNPGKKAVMLRINLRYTDYKLNEVDSWKQLYSGNLSVIYKFKTKLNNSRIQ